LGQAVIGYYGAPSPAVLNSSLLIQWINFSVHHYSLVSISNSNLISMTLCSYAFCWTLANSWFSL